MSTLKFALIGSPVKHSLSPPLHEAALLSFGLSGSYELIEIANEEVSKFIDMLPDSGLSGINVTIPHKESVFRLCKNRSFEAELTGAVNTVRVDSGLRLKAHNTDLGGFMQAAASVLKLKGLKLEQERALLLGAGGAARACLAGLYLMGFSSVLLLARKTDAAALEMERIRGAVQESSAKELELVIASFDDLQDGSGLAASDRLLSFIKQAAIVVNCTSVGLGDMEEAPVWADIIFAALSKNSSAAFMDTVYKKSGEPTVLMRKAAENGLSRQSDGIFMLASQAALAFEFWTGRRPQMAQMLSAIGRKF